MGIGWGVVQKTSRFNKHRCYPRTYPGIMYSTCFVITESNLLVALAIFPLESAVILFYVLD